MRGRVSFKQQLRQQRRQRAAAPAAAAGCRVAGLANTKPDPSAKKGGTLNVISNEGWEHLDPGESYFQIDYVVVYATQTPLYTFTPTSNKPVPLLASGPPQISADGKTVTVHIKPGLQVQRRRSTGRSPRPTSPTRSSGCSTRTCQNGYAAGYFPIVGSDKSAGKPIPGISTPEQDDDRLPPDRRTSAPRWREALSLPGTGAGTRGRTPPSSTRAARRSTTADPTSQAFTGPYIIKSYSAGRSITLVRNPELEPARSTASVRRTRTRSCGTPAPTRPSPLARRSTAPNLLMADVPPSSVLKTAYEQHKSSCRSRRWAPYVGAEHASPAVQQHQPTEGRDRRANREAYLLARGGKLVGQVPRTSSRPRSPASRQAGGYEGARSGLPGQPERAT